MLPRFSVESGGKFLIGEDLFAPLVDTIKMRHERSVLMDLGMPRMNGYEAAKHIRQQPWGGNMMLVALTGWGQAADKQRTKEAGFDHHLVKPAEPSELRRLLREVK